MSGTADETAVGSPSRRALALLAALVFLLHSALTGGHLTSPDEELMYRTAESIATRGSTSILPIEYDSAAGQLQVPPGATFATRLGQRGRYFAQYPIMQPALTAPIIWFAHATEGPFAEAFARHTWPTMASQYHSAAPEEFYRRGLVAMLFNPIVAAISAVVLARLAAHLCGNAIGGLASASLWAFGTIGWAHSRTYFTEPLAALLGLIAMGALIRWHTTTDPRAARRQAIIAGIALAAGVWTRVDFPIIAAGLIISSVLLSIYTAKSLASPPRFLILHPSSLILFSALCAGSFLLLQLFNSSRYGGVVLTAGYEDQSEGVKFSTPILVGLHGLFASPGKGLLFFSPALVLGIWGWVRGFERARAAAIIVMATWVPFFIAMAMWQNWDGGWCWGPRHVVQIHLPAMLGAAFLFEPTASIVRRTAIRFFAVAGVLVQLFGATQSPLDYYREYFTTLDDGVYFPLPYRPNETAAIAEEFRVSSRMSDREMNPAVLPTPLVDSLYVPQVSQWAAYPRMFDLGYLDLYWARVLFEMQPPPNRWKPAP